MDIDYDEILDRLKKHGKVRKDDEIAKHLGLSKQSLGGFKKRGKLPYEALHEYCLEHGIGMDQFLFGTDLGEKLNIELQKENERLKSNLELATSLIREALGKEK